MKKLLGGIVAVLVGEYLVMSRKDIEFQTELRYKKGWDKVGYIFSSLLQFNQNILEDIADKTKELKDIDLEDTIATLKKRAEQKYTNLTDTLHTFEEKISSYSEEEIEARAERLNKKYMTLKSDVQELIEQYDEKYDLHDKVAQLKKKLDKTLATTK